MTSTVDQGVAPPEKMKSHSLTPVGCGFGAECSNAGLLPVAGVAIVLAVVVTIVWNVGRRLIRRRGRGSSNIG
jgi:hypothetical protein